ncbi:hypothetical protein GCM10018963_04300 [Saccharothrix longispora]
MSGLSTSTSQSGAAANPAFTPAANPSLAVRATTRACGATRRTTSSVSSVEALSTTTTRLSGTDSSAVATEVRQSPTTSALW